MKKCSASINRTTKETSVRVDLTLDGSGLRKIQTPVNFLNHMLELFAAHGYFDLNIAASGDVQIDAHHTVEDTGIVLGQAFDQALGEKLGINRYGFFILPMDEALATVAIDFAGRYAFRFDCPLQHEIAGDLPTELVYDFWDAFSQNAKANLHVKVENGRNDHHTIEALFKAAARAIRMACALDPAAKNRIPSTKGSV